MTQDRRQPRAFRGTTTQPGLDPPNLPSVSSALVEWLEHEFPVTLSTGSPADVVQNQAEQSGRQQVIERLRSLSNNQE